MTEHEVAEPILNSPYEEPGEHWHLAPGEPAERRTGRRPAMYFYRPPTRGEDQSASEGAGTAIELKLVNLVRERVKVWRGQGYPGVTRTTLDLLRYWQRDGREHRLFFAQQDAAESIIFLSESRQDFRQGIEVPADAPSDAQLADGMTPFLRHACKMATGSGKTTVMGMLAAWSILNKITRREDARFSDVVLVVCPNVTIRNRLSELDPEAGDASIYRSRDLVPTHLMPELSQGRVLITNWHAFEPHVIQVGGVGARVVKAGAQVRVRERIAVGERTTTAHGHRYMTLPELERQVGAGTMTVLKEDRDEGGALRSVFAESIRYEESDTSFVNRVLGREVGGKQNILVMNDEAHHAYRIKPLASENGNGLDEIEDEQDEDDEDDYFVKEATVWIDGLDRIHKLRGINRCLDFSATPYFLGRVGQQANRPFPWIVSDFSLTDAIESGLVKIPQLAVRDSSGRDIPGYFNIWRWILPQLTPAERGGKRSSPKPEAILKYAYTPITMLANLWEGKRLEWEKRGTDPRPPVFILVCKNTKIAKVVYEWIAEAKTPMGISSVGVDSLRNGKGEVRTIRVDTRVVHETDSGHAKSDEVAWMRVTLDTVGKVEWPRGRLGEAILPDGFEELATKLKRPMHPPGRDVRCIVSVGMLTEGWDCNTVTHIVGLRPFMSQLLCEQVVGRALRRPSYEIGENGKLSEEIAQVFGVPFEVVPLKQSKGGTPPPPVKRFHVHAIPSKAALEIKFPRVEGYRQGIRSKLTVDWATVPSLVLNPAAIPPEVEMKATLPANIGRPTLTGPGRLESVTLNPFRSGRRFQELAFEIAKDLTRGLASQASSIAPAHILFPQLVQVAERYLKTKVEPVHPAQLLDVFCSPYYGWVIERLAESVRPDTGGGEAPELPRLETSRGPGTTRDVDFWTSREVREVVKSHVNYITADTKLWEQTAAYFIDSHPSVESFAKNAGLGLAIPYVDNGEHHDYMPDFIVRFKGEGNRHLILETKGYDPLAEVKAAAASRWVAAVNADGTFGTWRYAVARKPSEVVTILGEQDA